MRISSYFIIFVVVLVIRSLSEILLKPKNENFKHDYKGFMSLIIFVAAFFIISLSVGYYIFTDNMINPTILYIGLLIFILIHIIRILVTRKMKKSYNLYITPTEKSQLITTGANNIVRHPIYLLYTLEITALLMVWFNYIGFIALMIDIIATLHRINEEEKLLMNKFKTDYENYKRKVKFKIFPFIY